MPDELFPPSSVESLSPRLQWLKKHDLITKRQGYDFTAHPLSWCCSNRAMTMCGWGETEEDSMWDYSRRYKVRHFSESNEAKI